MENHHLQWVNPATKAIFNSYVKLPEDHVGGLGVELCSLDAVLVFATVRERSRPLETVCEQPSWQKVAVPIEVLHVTRVAYIIAFRVAGVALRDMWTCLVTC